MKTQLYQYEVTGPDIHNEYRAEYEAWKNSAIWGYGKTPMDAINDIVAQLESVAKSAAINRDIAADILEEQNNL